MNRREFLKKMLGGLGCGVVAVASPALAVAALKPKEPKYTSGYAQIKNEYPPLWINNGEILGVKPKPGEVFYEDIQPKWFKL